MLFRPATAAGSCGTGTALLLPARNLIGELIPDILNLQKFQDLSARCHNLLLRFLLASYCSRILFLQDGKIFHELVRGEKSRRVFLQEILDVLSLTGGVLSDILNLQKFQDLSARCHNLLLRFLLQSQRQYDIFPDGQRIQQIVLLKHKSQIIPAKV